MLFHPLGSRVWYGRDAGDTCPSGSRVWYGVMPGMRAAQLGSRVLYGRDAGDKCPYLRLKGVAGGMRGRRVNPSGSRVW